MLEYCDLLEPPNVKPTVYVPPVKELADRKNCPVSKEVLRNVAEGGIAVTAVLRIPSRYNEGVICT